jgi:protein-tyrosine phosphatase
MTFKKTIGIFLLSLCLLGCSKTTNKQSADQPQKSSFENFDLSRVHLITYDSDRNVFLFRGNIPIIGDENRKLVYEQLISSLKKRAEEQNLTIPDKFSFIDYSLVNSWERGGKRDRKIEEDFFTKNPSLGTLISWPILLTSSKEVDKKIIELAQMVNDKAISNKVFYLHCEAGCDRTGGVAAAYRMRILSTSYEDSMALNLKECGRKQNRLSVFSTYRYCKFLKKRGLIDEC